MPNRRRFLGLAAAMLAGGTGVSCVRLPWSASQSPEPLPSEGNMPPLDGAAAWLNSAPLTTPGLRGKVVLVNFWTYTCVNWMRELPYVRAWAAKYSDHGLVVVGVHTPEFSFEHDADNVRRAAKDLRVEYPIAIDNEYQIWDSFANRFWPALYFVDAMGRIRHHSFGEGAYEGSERVLQQLLREAVARDIGDELVAVEPRGAEIGADWGDLQSPESYLGVARTENFASPGGIVGDRPHGYSAPSRLNLNQWAVDGNWTFGNEAVVLSDAGGRIAFQFRARDVNMVMGPLAPDGSASFRVRVDGAPPGAAHGFDVDGEGNGLLDYRRLYQLVRQPGPVAERRFEIEFQAPGAAGYAFTFG